MLVNIACADTMNFYVIPGTGSVKINGSMAGLMQIMENMGNLHLQGTLMRSYNEKNVTAWPVHQTLRCLDQYLLDDVAVKN